MLLTIQQLIAAQQNAAHCRHLDKKADAPNSPFIFDELDILSRRTLPDGAIQNFVPAFLKKAVLMQEHESTISSQPEARRM